MANISATMVGKMFSNYKKYPKQIELYDNRLNRLDNKWVRGSKFSFNSLEIGEYFIRISINENTHEEYFKVHEGLNKFEFGRTKQNTNNDELSINMRSSQISLNYRHTDKFETFKIDPVNPPILLLLGSVERRRWITLRGLLYNNFSLEQDMNSVLVSFSIRTEDGIHLLSFPELDGRWRYICLPPNNDVFVQIRVPQSSRGRIIAYISTSDDASNILLRKLQGGIIKDAKPLLNARIAERLLLEKKRDASAAAIGGYFLLKTKELYRLHDWANNLANWFPEMADGAIIHAWQLIEQRGGEKQVKDRLLEAVTRKMPIYTEGYRLLLEGLGLLSSVYKGKDEEVEAAYIKVSKYRSMIDWEQGFTTITMSGRNMDSIDDSFFSFTH